MFVLFGFDIKHCANPNPMCFDGFFSFIIYSLDEQNARIIIFQFLIVSTSQFNHGQYLLRSGW